MASSLFETPGLGGLLAEYLLPEERQVVRKTEYPEFGFGLMDPLEVQCDAATESGLLCHRNVLSPTVEKRCLPYCKQHITEDLRNAFAFVDSTDPVILTKRGDNSISVELGDVGNKLSRELRWTEELPGISRRITRKRGGTYVSKGLEAPTFKTDDEFLAALTSGKLAGYNRLRFTEPASSPQIASFYGGTRPPLNEFGFWSQPLEVTSNIPWLHDNVGETPWSATLYQDGSQVDADTGLYDQLIGQYPSSPEIQEGFLAETALVPFWYRTQQQRV